MIAAAVALASAALGADLRGAARSLDDVGPPSLDSEALAASLQHGAG